MSVVDIDRGESGHYLLRFNYDPHVLDAIKTIPSRKWTAGIRAHIISEFDVELTITALRTAGIEFYMTPEAEQSITKHITTVKNLLIVKNQPLETAVASVKLKLPLRSFQMVGHNYLIEAKSCLLCDEMGLGKSIQIISAFKTLKEQGKVNKMMVICPSSVKSGWEKDIRKFTDLKSVIIEGTPRERALLYEKEYDIIILGYEVYLSDFGANSKTKKLPMPKVEIAVCDECQRLVRIKNKTTQSLLIMKEKLQLQYIYLVTGTPIINRIEDLWSLLTFVNPNLVGDFWQFRNRYCVIEYKEIKILDKALRKQGVFKKKAITIPKVIGYKNLEELKTKIDPYYIRREKKNVLSDLPDKIYETYDIELSRNQRLMYEIMQADFAKAYRSNDVSPANALVWLIRAKQICDSNELIDTENNDSSKLVELKNLLEDLIPMDDDKKNFLEGGHKVVLFSQYKEMTDIFCREFQQYNPLYLHGQVDSKDRPLLIDAFQTDPKYHIFVSTLRAGGVGITLTASDVVILYDKWFSPAANNQATDRVHRIGQKNSVTVIDFICKDTVEERIEKILERKKAMFDGMFGDDNTILAKLTVQEIRSLL